ncbi:MAG: hypothetical protein PVG64_02125 [Syntrophobacterales bacterium]|jgi:hypothetical protein
MVFSPDSVTLAPISHPRPVGGGCFFFGLVHHGVVPCQQRTVLLNRVAKIAGLSNPLQLVPSLRYLLSCFCLPAWHKECIYFAIERLATCEK